MCTVALILRPAHPWPVMLAANRDEMLDRAWDKPGPWWPERPGVVAGRDRTAGGTWMGVNRHGLLAAVLNRPGSLGPAAGKRSRGELPLLALAQPGLAAAVAAVAALDARAWRGFNLVLADRSGAVVLRGTGHSHPEQLALAPGVHMVTAHDPDDAASPRVARHLPRLIAATPPDADDWAGWGAVMADRAGSAAEQINVTPRGGFGTVCAARAAIGADAAVAWWFAAGPPDAAAFVPVA
ncbi:MAG: NRDE family protein [Acetobacteraceae bacterium]